MRWPWRKNVRKEVEEARQRRIAAERQLEQETRETIRPLAQMYRENHIGPLMHELVRSSRERGRHDPGTTHG